MHRISVYVALKADSPISEKVIWEVLPSLAN